MVKTMKILLKTQECKYTCFSKLLKVLVKVLAKTAKEEKER